jgi:hypothetical protein
MQDALSFGAMATDAFGFINMPPELKRWVGSLRASHGGNADYRQPQASHRCHRFPSVRIMQ